jgi:hypothetical protein
LFAGVTNTLGGDADVSKKSTEVLTEIGDDGGAIDLDQ